MDIDQLAFCTVSSTIPTNSNQPCCVDRGADPAALSDCQRGINVAPHFAIQTRTVSTEKTSVYSWVWKNNFSLMDGESDASNTTGDFEFVMVHGISDERSAAHTMEKLEAPGYKVRRQQRIDENRCSRESARWVATCTGLPGENFEKYTSNRVQASVVDIKWAYITCSSPRWRALVRTERCEGKKVEIHERVRKGGGRMGETLRECHGGHGLPALRGRYTRRCAGTTSAQKRENRPWLVRGWHARDVQTHSEEAFGTRRRIDSTCASSPWY